MEKLKVINLGCGNDYKKSTEELDIINIDFNPEFCKNGIDLVCDIRNLPYEANSIDMIIAEGCLEHLSYRDHLPTLIHWLSILKPGGWLYIETPNLMTILDDIKNQNGYLCSHAYETLYGGQRNRTEYHIGLHSDMGLQALLSLAGFTEIQIQDPTKNIDKKNWNIRIKATKLYPWSFPGLSK